MFVVFIEWISSISAVVAFTLTVTQMWAHRSYWATQLYLTQCDAALDHPRFSNPALMKLDLKARTADGDTEAFERYEWFVARLVYALDEVLHLTPTARWLAVAKTQLANHRPYFASEYYAKQGYLPHCSWRMRKMIGAFRNA